LASTDNSLWSSSDTASQCSSGIR